MLSYRGPYLAEHCYCMLFLHFSSHCCINPVISDIVLFCSWQVNGQVTEATQTNFDSELHLEAVDDAVVNCTADNSFGADSKTAEITVLGKKLILLLCCLHFIRHFVLLS